MVNKSSYLPGQDGRVAAADFEPLPRGHRRRRPVMRGELAEVVWFTGLQGHRAVRNPDAFPIEIQLTGGGAAGGFLRTSAGKQGPVEHGQLRMPGWIRNGNRE